MTGIAEVSEGTVSPAEELDLSGDSAVEVIEAVWQITEAESEETESDNGKGTRVNLTFEAEDEAFPYPITMRFFTTYEPVDSSKNTDWVKRQRGQLKNVAKAAIGEPRLSLDPSNPNYIVGKRVRATTKDGGDGFATLGKFKKVD